MQTKEEIQKELCKKYGEQLQSVMDVVGNLTESGDRYLENLLTNIIEEADLLREGSYEKVLNDEKSLTSIKALMDLYQNNPGKVNRLTDIYWKIFYIRSELAIKLGKQKLPFYVC